MRFNFNRSTSKTLEIGQVKPQWLITLLNEYADDHDINQKTIGLGFLQTCIGLPELVEWMQDKGYSVSYWETSSKFESNIPIAFGLDILETCPKFTELRLRCE